MSESDEAYQRCCCWGQNYISLRAMLAGIYADEASTAFDHSNTRHLVAMLSETLLNISDKFEPT